MRAWLVITGMLISQIAWTQSRIGSLNFGGSFAFSQTNFSENYLEGHADYRVSKMVSLKGKGLYSLDQDIPAHFLLAGPNFHFQDKSFDPYLSIGNGINITSNDAVPAVHFGGGFNYYLGSIFHFNAEYQWINNPLGNGLTPFLSVGLYFNLKLL